MAQVLDTLVAMSGVRVLVTAIVYYAIMVIVNIVFCYLLCIYFRHHTSSLSPCVTHWGNVSYPRQKLHVVVEVITPSR